VDGARRVVDLATKIAGASSLYKRNELERLYRDVRSGPFHPPTTDVAYDLIGRSYLGVLGAPA
jgi:alkylation response protein AidB-like acyl-CoA dehydrogenase